MCKFDVKYKDGIGFVARNYAECGTCKFREWCPLYMISIRNRAKQYKDSKDTPLPEDAATLVDEIIIEGALHIINNLEKDIDNISINEGKEFLRKRLYNHENIELIRKLILLEEERSKND